MLLAIHFFFPSKNSPLRGWKQTQKEVPKILQLYEFI